MGRGRLCQSPRLQHPERPVLLQWYLPLHTAIHSSGRHRLIGLRDHIPSPAAESLQCWTVCSAMCNDYVQISDQTRLYSDFNCDGVLENTSKIHSARELQQRATNLHTNSQVGWNNDPLPDSQSLPYDRRGHNPHQGVHGQSRVSCKVAPLVYKSAKNRVSLWSKDDQTKTLADQSKNECGFIGHNFGAQGWAPAVDRQICTCRKKYPGVEPGCGTQMK